MIMDTSTSQEHPASSKPPAMSSIFQSVLDDFKLNGVQPNFKLMFLTEGICRPSKMSSRTSAPVRNVHNHPRLHQQLQQCYQFLRVILMPSISTDFNQILNLAYSGHMQTIKNVIQDTSNSQEYP